MSRKRKKIKNYVIISNHKLLLWCDWWGPQWNPLYHSPAHSLSNWANKLSHHLQRLIVVSRKYTAEEHARGWIQPSSTTAFRSWPHTDLHTSKLDQSFQTGKSVVQAICSTGERFRVIWRERVRGCFSIVLANLELIHSSNTRQNWS